MPELSKYIEYTLIKPDTALSDVKKVCEEAMAHQFAGICIPPLFARDARRILGEYSKIRLATIIGFPMGYSAIAAKSEEIKRAVEEGVDEVDGVLNIAAIKTGNWNHVEHDIDSMARAAYIRGKILKLIVECGLLSPDELKKVGALAAQYRVTWLVTCTGFHGFQATPDMVRALAGIAEADIKIKAAGGIRTAAAAQALLDAGAARIGTSTPFPIIK
jgi:deoxyribose-phosphate aldolase